MTPAPTPPARGGGGCLKGLLGFALLTLGGAVLCCLSTVGLGLLTGLEPPTLELATPVDLGTARVPEELDAARIHQHRWRQALQRYDVGYGAGDEVKDDAHRRLTRLARELGYRPGEGGEFLWAPPRDCRPEPWSCVYRTLARDNRVYLAGLARLFVEHARLRELDQRGALELVVGFVQNITYRLPDHEAFGLLPPTVVAADGWGDCDSKTLLAALVLDELGIDTVVLHSDALKHAALGVAVPGAGRSFAHRGRRYLYVEVTSPGWPVGTMPPEVDTPRLWTAVSWK